jgi:hypothetical protein
MNAYDSMEITSSPLPSTPPGLDDIPELSPTQYKSEAIVISSDSEPESEGWKKPPNLATNQQQQRHHEFLLENNNNNNQNPTPTRNHNNNDNSSARQTMSVQSSVAQALQNMSWYEYTILDHATTSPPAPNPPITVLLALTPQPATIADQAAFEDFGARFSEDFSNVCVEETWGVVSLYAHYREWAQRHQKSGKHHSPENGGGWEDAGNRAHSSNHTPKKRIIRWSSLATHEAVQNGDRCETSTSAEQEERGSGDVFTTDAMDLTWVGLSKTPPGASPVPGAWPVEDSDVVTAEPTTTAGPTSPPQSDTTTDDEKEIGNIHPSALLAKLEQETDVHWRFFIPVLQQLIDHKVKEGTRQIIVGGFKIGDLAGIRAFAQKVSLPLSIPVSRRPVQIVLTQESFSTDHRTSRHPRLPARRRPIRIQICHRTR